MRTEEILSTLKEKKDKSKTIQNLRESEKLREDLSYINKNISTAYNQQIKIKNSIEKELENFIE